MLQTPLTGKKILLGITGGIAAYKTPNLVRLLKKAGADVQVVCTPSALDFVAKNTLAVVSERPVLVDFFDANGKWNEHVQWGLWADLILLAPLTANSLAKLAYGICDNFLLATVLSARCGVWLAPAMDLDMFTHPTTVLNLKRVADLGYQIIEPETGSLASGLSGKGRLPEPETLAQIVETVFQNPKPEAPQPQREVEAVTPETSFYRGKHVLVTAGATKEAIDPVRFISNHSSGKMGIAIAEALVQAGAIVHLVYGNITTPLPDYCYLYPVESAVDMLNQCLSLFPKMDAAWMVAAVADYRIENIATEKIKKSEDQLTLHLVKNPDILKTLGELKTPKQKIMGFALETEKEEFHALEKLQKKNADAIVLNSLKNENVGFGKNTNEVTVYFKNGEKHPLPANAKTHIAQELLSLTSQCFQEQTQ